MGRFLNCTHVCTHDRDHDASANQTAASSGFSDFSGLDWRHRVPEAVRVYATTTHPPTQTQRRERGEQALSGPHRARHQRSRSLAWRLRSEALLAPWAAARCCWMHRLMRHLPLAPPSAFALALSLLPSSTLSPSASLLRPSLLVRTAPCMTKMVLSSLTSTWAAAAA